VLFAPSFKFNLISIHSLTVHLLKSDVNFSASSCVLQAPSLKRPLKIDRERNRLYFLCTKYQSSESHCSPFISLTATSSSFMNSCKPNDMCDISESDALCDISVSQAHSPSPIPSVNTYSSHNKEACSSHDSSLINCSSSDKSVNSLWHNRLGHVPFIKMKGISSIQFNLPISSLSCVIFVPWQDRPGPLFHKNL